MAREANGADVVGGGRAVDASLRPLESANDADDAEMHTIDTEEDDSEESDGDFELESMGDDDEDDDEEESEEKEARADAQEDEDDLMGHLDADANELRDELMALAAAVADDGSGARDDRIAHRTRTKLSLVDVEIDSLESLLPPDTMDNSFLIRGENEYQRFLSSLLPTEEDNLSFLDEEDEEYRPDEEEEEEDDNEYDGERNERRQRADTTGSEGDVLRSGSGEFGEEDDEEDDEEDKQVVRVSKRELTELLWDSTQVKVPPKFPRATTSDAQAVASAPATASAAVRVPRQVSDPSSKKDQGDEAADATSEALAELKDAAAMKDVNGSVSPQQCIQLASQMHKHFQLLLQTFHMIAATEATPATTEDRAQTDATQTVKTAAQAKKDQLDECTAMLRDLQVRGERALEYKAQVLSKITMNTSNGGGGGSKATRSDRVDERRVTRSISAAHAAVAHPSMFDIVGSQSMEELTKAFERGCSVTDRNQKLKKSMLELDKHILLNRKKRRGSTPRKILFLAAEDRLLLQGVKRYGVEQDAWTEIRETLLPTKEVHVLNKRFRYLASKKKRGGGNDFKEFNNESHSRKKGIWMVEEDVRLTRGVIEYFGANRRFARISSKYLPHRGRLEIRKRWERLKERYRTEDGAVKEFDESLPPPRAMLREFPNAVKAYLEGKLRQKLVETSAVPVAATVGKKTPSRGAKPSNAAKKAVREPVKDPVIVEPSSCSVKNLHPALFFSSWAVINPAMLLEQTCEHNWPAFISEKRKDIASASTLDLVSRAAASRVEEEAATHRAGLASREKRLEPIQEDHDEELASSGVEFSLDTVESEENEGVGTGDDEESDFERDELLSSDAEESDSEYERMELSDDDDEEDVDDESFDEGEISHDEGASGVHDEDTRPARVKHTLRLANFRQQGENTRAMRALEALERRIAGNQPSVAGPTTGFTTLAMDAAEFEPLAANEAPFNDADLLAYEELGDSPSSGGDDDSEYEQDELPSSSDEDSGNEVSDEASVAADRSKRLREAAGVQPLKRPKLQQGSLTRCHVCGSAPCVCASARLQRLMARIQPSEREDPPPDHSATI